MVVLNGGSSSGKTSLVRTVQGLLEEPWVALSVDDLVDALPRSGPGSRTITFGADGSVHVGPEFRRVERAWLAALATIARAGVGVLVDDVFLDGRTSQDRLRAHLSGVQVLWVGVRCDPDVAAARELARGDRPLGMARAQAERVHVGAAYDLEVDTGTASLQDCARDLAAAVAHRRGAP
ncbi:chloramphenicol 3-O phosphotransferase [Motilibacter peucedani]|uniref:Chloramphenicol 3-O phosphotransferase n=2 Tax=Motilibacter peucedani TaxID=598650 RepID=A0A420XMI4_9ACTN|nr:chloramphenicol 3-O phosphotransferase [Motilibacter peucedani]